MRASGTFEVELKEQPTVHPDAGLGRRTIDKHFSGDLEASSKGEMLSIGGQVKGSAAYVALELVTGTLGGKTGSFALQHVGTMKRGDGKLSVGVVPDSGTGELSGITGSLSITIVDGRHEYVFDYDLERA